MLAVSAAFPRNDCMYDCDLVLTDGLFFFSCSISPLSHCLVGSNSVLYFDTEKAFSSLRLSEMAASYHRQFLPNSVATNQSNADQRRDSELDMQAEVGEPGMEQDSVRSTELEASVMELINHVTVFDIGTTSQLMDKLQTLGV